MLDVTAVRSRFPALSRTEGVEPVVYADGPGGTQVPDSVIVAMSEFLARGGANLGGPFATSVETEELVVSARRAVADLVGASRPEEIVFGQNMTSLTLALGRALARGWRSGDEIVCTRLDHDANVSSWMQAAGEAGATVRLAEFDRGTGRLEPEAVARMMTGRTRHVAVTLASNAIGTIVDVPAIAAMARLAGATIFVDAVHQAPHGRIDVKHIGCDFLAASAYKFFGPHTGVMYGRYELLDEIEAVRIRPAPTEPPGKWETGTQSFESLAGVTAAIDYLASLGDGPTRRAALGSAMGRIGAYERVLAQRFLDGVAELPHVTVHGTRKPERRTPTFAVAVESVSPAVVAAELGRTGIYVWDGHYYALEVMSHLGVLESGGLVRIGFVHYNTVDEVDRVLDALASLRV